MFYFKYFPNLQDDNQREIKNIFRRFDFLLDILNNDSLFFTYESLQGESIENIALNVYGSEDYSWVVLFSNRNLNPFYANFKSDQELLNYCKRKYGVNLFDTKLYRTSDNKIVDDVDRYYFEHNKYLLKYRNLVPINYYQLEKEANESRRNFRLLNPEFLTTLVRNIDSIFNPPENS